MGCSNFSSGSLIVPHANAISGIIGVHPIFGAFLIGLICPHDGGFAIKMTEKIEDLISVVFLPLYFALSGLSTDLGLLNDGIAWAYVVGVIACAFAGKIIGGTLAARFNNLEWRESFTIGCLMSCKGLVELIVLVCLIAQPLGRPAADKNTEHWSECQNLVSKDVYNLRGHGAGKDETCSS